MIRPIKNRQIRGISFKWTLMAGFVVGAGIILILYLSFMRLAENAFYDRVYVPPVYVSVDYFNELQEDAYDSIPDVTVNGNEYIVYDGEGNVVFMTSSDLGISYEDARYLCDSIENWSDNSIVVVEAMYGYDRYVYTQRYETLSGEERLIVELIPQDIEYHIEEAERKSRIITLIGALAGAAVVVLTTWILNKQIKWALSQVDKAIVSYQNDQRFPSEERQVIPSEFQGVVDDLDMMMNRVEHARTEQARAEQSRSRMIADLSHDLKTPLTVISGYSKAMLDGVVPEKDRQAYLTAIHQKALYTSGLMDELFEYSKMEHPEYTPDKEHLDYCEFCRSYLGEKYTELELQGFVIQADIPEEPIIKDIDRRLYRRLLENLISNIQKHNQPGTNIYFRVYPENGRLVTIVADNGIGIPGKIADRIFEPFVKGDEARASGRGTGLGMAVAKKITALHNGTIELVIPPEAPYSTEVKIVL